MKTLRRSEEVFGMSVLNPNKTHLPVTIWADHGGKNRGPDDMEPRVKLGNDEMTATISIAEKPKLMGKSRGFDFTVIPLEVIQEVEAYVGKYYEIFLAHFNDADWSFDDERLIAALREHGAYDE